MAYTTCSDDAQQIGRRLPNLTHQELIRLHADIEDYLEALELYTVTESGQAVSEPLPRQTAVEFALEAQAANPDKDYNLVHTHWRDDGSAVDSVDRTLLGYDNIV